MNKYRVRKILSYLPEAVFLLFSLRWIFDLTERYNNWITWTTISLTVLIIIMIVSRNRIIAIINAVICGLTGLAFLIHNLFGITNIFNTNTSNILEWSAAVAISLSLIALALIMPWKYFAKVPVC